MGTATINGALVLEVPVTLLGPGSEYEKRHIALKKDINQLILDASKITQVTTPEELESANNAGRVLQASTKEVENFYTPLKRQVDAFKAPLLLHEKEFAGPVDAEKKRLGGLITGYNQEVQRKQQEAERIAREASEAAAREEALNRAVEIEATEGKEAAEQFLSEPIMAAPVVIQQEAPTRMAGQVSKTTFKCVVTDVKVTAQGCSRRVRHRWHVSFSIRVGSTRRRLWTRTDFRCLGAGWIKVLERSFGPDGVVVMVSGHPLLGKLAGKVPRGCELHFPHYTVSARLIGNDGIAARAALPHSKIWNHWRMD